MTPRRKPMRATAKPAKLAKPQHLPARLSKADMEYHSKLLQEAAWAREAEQRIAATQAAIASWSHHIQEKYQLKEGDAISNDGKFTRGPEADD